MAILRLNNGNDVTVKLSVAEVISAMEITAGRPDFVELPGEDGPIHIRPSAVIAILEDAHERHAGFRIAE